MTTSCSTSAHQSINLVRICSGDIDIKGLDSSKGTLVEQTEMVRE